MISVVITTHNEGDELQRTIASARRNTNALRELLVVDDGSCDDAHASVEAVAHQVIRHPSRIGVAYSRNEATRQASGDAVAYLDAHQRVSRDCLDRCSEVALAEHAIVSVDFRGFGLLSPRAYGASFRLCPKRGYFAAELRRRRPRSVVSRVSGLWAPAYVIPKALFERVCWVSALRGWGASEATVALKAFFTGIDILHVRGPLAKHRFRRKFPYRTTWEEIWRNHALLARVCFDDRTWYEHWLPEVFDRHLTAATRDELESDGVRAEHEAFLGIKVRSDHAFWTKLLGTQVPPCLRN